ncbi:unnamed protein product [Cylicocyclus nassatus]|uniref:Major facilitator superfamily (MFS) profile domain-containing protein n=1 Tax=Cylicocyclus nassatus TaxID=53992 RepID=A0AA36M9H5_CYLNA|nr:unnamed protein product [Cylicocyclus nassatus]
MERTTLLSKHGMRLFAFGWILTTITNFPAAFTHTSVNSAVLKMNEYLNESFTDRYRPLDHYEVSLIKSGINSIWYVGQVFGALMSPYVCDNWGRKPAYIISVVMMTAACGMQMIASLTPFPEILIVGRLITAVFSPLSDAALILYLQEISPCSLRGTMSSLFSTGYSVMCLFGMLLGHEDVLGHSLTVLLFVPVIPGVISTVVLLLMPETPKFLMISQHNAKAALASLRFYQGDREDLQNALDKLQIEGKRADVEDGETNGSIKAIITTPHLRKAFTISVAVLVLTLPFYPILQNSTFFFTHLNVQSNLAQLSSSLLMVLLTFACVTSTCVVDRFPRRFMLLTAGTICMFALSAFVMAAEFGSKYAAMTGVFVFVFSYGVGVGPVAWFISGEMVPLQYRSGMFCLCYAVHSLLVVLTNFATVPLLGAIGAVCFVPIFIIPCSLALTYVYFSLPETNGKDTMDIVKELKGSHRKFDVTNA